MTSSNSQHPKPEQLSYRDAGVNIDAGNLLVEKIKPFAQRTWRPEILAGIGGFGALFEVPQKYRNPVLVSGTDGVGTKLKVAFQFNQHDSIGIDLVAMSVNDILVQGAEPLFFLDYFACGSLNVDTATRVVQGIAAGCEQAGCALIGGETAEMPGMYPEGEYDLAGFAVGIVEKSSIINGSTISENDIILGIASNGAHANGFSLIRKIIEKHPVDLNAKLGNSTLIEAIMAPTRIYVKPVLELIRKLPVKGLAHITGGGLLENIPRILPTGMMVYIQQDSWEIPLLFHWLQQQGNVANEEMFRVFNCGIGMVLVVAPEHADEAMAVLHACGETVWRIGHIKQRHADEPAILIA
ncbi:phosphoribosylformylglycinamidine cyclo-ligase [Nitrosomonas sp. Nm132]|uniref:phosphoribosylformylglycinamidine cyclo-ligase n=1 Tax=Nitrosomonas sp. Nm132 TaxID=1881053 RepID=UPI0008885395|nr:phosphoribosylformylglycinamidine cyclo-ligase [Nitrosomonas sp. Nm132]SDH66834.1 phosphoribosylformylglycinamidine cyclo-ligase [Nitrosomonas sp. Nm132]